MRWRRTAGGFFQQFLAGVSRLGKNHGDLGSVTVDPLGSGMKTEVRETGLGPLGVYLFPRPQIQMEQGYQWEKFSLDS